MQESLDDAFLLLGGMMVTRDDTGRASYQFLPSQHQYVERGVMRPYLLTEAHPESEFERGYLTGLHTMRDRAAESVMRVCIIRTHTLGDINSC